MANPGALQKNFWIWLKRGSGDAPGYRRILNWKLWTDAAVGLCFGLCFGLLVRKSLPDTARTVLFPLAAVLIGTVFAWTGSAQELLQTEEIVDIAKRVPGGYPD